VVFVSAVPILAILILELRYGIVLLDYLLGHAFSYRPLGESSGLDVRFFMFVAFMVMLFGYVFIGGFRAVITSDVWQFKTMRVTLGITMISLIVLAWERQHVVHSGVLQALFPPRSVRELMPFYIGVAIINFFTPICFATSWQRFRAFRDQSIDFRGAMWSALRKMGFLWVTLIVIGILIPLLTGRSTDLRHLELSSIMDDIRVQSSWFQLVVFPLLIVAAFSGMYSTSDTCVSALLYLTESNRRVANDRDQAEPKVRKHYYWMMLSVGAMAVAMYFVVTLTTTSAGSLMSVAMSLFGNAVVLAPTVILLTNLNKPTDLGQAQLRTAHLSVSIVCGVAVYWIVWLVPALQSWAILIGLATAFVPALLLLQRERNRGGEHTHARTVIGDRGDLLRKASGS
jgi:hypothetical protein